MINVDQRRHYISALIAHNPTSISLTRHTVSDAGYGAGVDTASSISAQTFRMELLPRPVVRYSDTGDALVATVWMLGEYAADIQPGDTFTIDSQTYEVIYVRRFPHKTEADVRIVP